MSATLSEMSFLDMVRLGTALHPNAQHGDTLLDLGARLAPNLHRALLDTSGKPATVLVRCFSTRRFADLSGEEQEIAEAVSEVEPHSDTRFVCLLGTAGIKPAWCSVRQSRTHRIMAMHRLTPMFKAAFGGARGGGPVEAFGEHIDMFYVPEPLGSPWIPRQDFIQQFGVKSVVGFTYELPPSERVFVILFTHVPVERRDVTHLRALALDTWLRMLAVSNHGPTNGASAPERQITPTERSERVRALEELVALQRSQLEEQLTEVHAASRAKSEFLAAMSHEIRTPLNGVLGLLELLRRTDLDSEQREYVQTARASAQHLLGLVDDILDLSKIEAGRLDIHPAPFDLHRVVQDTISVCAQKAWEKGIEVEKRFDAGVPTWVLGDALRLRQVLVNLIGNAVKFSSRGTISIDVSAEGHVVTFSVSDQGIGIAAATRDRIFEPFVQGEQSTTRRFGGSGLGLYLCKTLTQLMGGSIWVESELGIGSTFSFTADLPATPAPLDVPETSEEATSLPPAPAEVLVAEDNAVNRLVIVRLLEQLGHHPKVAVDGVEALHAVREHDFDLVLMDVEMPELDGLAATKLIRRLEKARGLRIVALTAHVTSEHRKRCLESGMDDVLTKPLDIKRLERELSSVGKRKAHKRRHGMPRTEHAVGIIDRASALARLGGDEALLEEILQAVRDEIAPLKIEIGAGIEREDRERTARNAHSLKGALLNVGATIGPASALAIEDAARAGDWQAARTAFGKLGAELATIDQELAASLAKSMKTNGDNP